ncbi:MAG: hypothetical protein HY714_00080 [Candidatus Omnitrophica bacterium]|nr:hypothetical protein [Candidatus Omnitrophota bacterium]
MTDSRFWSCWRLWAATVLLLAFFLILLRAFAAQSERDRQKFFFSQKSESPLPLPEGLKRSRQLAYWPEHESALQVVLWPWLALVCGGGIYAVVLTLRVPVEWSRTKKISGASLLRMIAVAAVLGAAVPVVRLGTRVWVSDEPRRELSAAEAYQAQMEQILGKWIEIANEFYELERLGDYGARLTQLQYLRLKAQDLNDALRRAVPVKHSGAFEVNSGPFLAAMGDFFRRLDIYLEAALNPAESEQGRATAQFYDLLENIHVPLRVAGDQICLRPAVLQTFKVSARQTFQEIGAAPAQARYSNFLLFGYYLYDWVLRHTEGTGAGTELLAAPHEKDQ